MSATYEDSKFRLDNICLYLSFPKKHRRKLHSTNISESFNKKIKTRYILILQEVLISKFYEINKIIFYKTLPLKSEKAFIKQLFIFIYFIKSTLLLKRCKLFLSNLSISISIYTFKRWSFRSIFHHFTLSSFVGLLISSYF